MAGTQTCSVCRWRSTATPSSPARSTETAPGESQGALYTFARTGAAERNETGKLTASDGAVGDDLGTSVAIDGDTIVAGAPHDEVGSNQFQGSASIFNSADLAITMTDSPDPVITGQDITYDLSVENNGPNDAARVKVTDDLPENVSFKSAGTSGNCTNASGRVPCDFGTVGQRRHQDRRDRRSRRPGRDGIQHRDGRRRRGRPDAERRPQHGDDAGRSRARHHRSDRQATGPDPDPRFDAREQRDRCLGPTQITWAAGSDDSPSAGLRYRLEERVNSGSFTPLGGFTTTRSARRTLVPGRTYQYRVVARDGAGNLSTAATGPRSKVDARQESSSLISYTGTWLRRLARSTAWGGGVRPTTAAGAKAKTSFTGRNVAVVLPRAANLGTARVRLFRGSTPLACANVDQSPRSGLGQRKAVFVRNGLSPTQTHRIEVTRSVGRVELDGIVALR